MKKLIPLVAGAVLCLASCATDKAISVSQYAPLAVVSVYGNSSVPWYSDSDGSSQNESSSTGILSGLVNRTLNPGNPEVEGASSRVDDAADALFAALSDAGVALVDTETVQGSQMVKSQGNFFLKRYGDMVPADGFKSLDAGSSGTLRTIAAQTGAESLLYVKFTFQKVKEADSLTTYIARARVVMDVTVADSTGSKLLRSSYAQKSVGYVRYKNGDYDKEALVELFPDTVSAVIGSFIADITQDAAASDAGTAADDGSLYGEATPIRMPGGSE